MTRTKALSTSTTENEIAVPATESFEGWAKLNTEEQKEVKREADAVLDARVLEGKSRAAQGQHLLRIKQILEPKRMFVAFIDHKFHMSRATAYRYIEEYETGTQRLPAPVLEAVMARGMPIPSKEILEVNPPPKSDKPEDIQEYITKLEELPQRVSAAAQETDPNILMKEVVNFFRLRFNRLEGTPQFKQKWAKRSLAMCATVGGIHSEFSVAPLEIPPEFQVHVGRPKEVKSEVKPAA